MALELSSSESIPPAPRPRLPPHPIFSTSSLLSAESMPILMPPQVRILPTGRNSRRTRERACTIDLMNTSVPGALCAPRLARKAIVRAAVYRQIRLRLISDEPAPGDPLPNDNKCGGRSFNCVVDTNGHTRALVMKNAANNVLIMSDHITDGSFNVLPDAATQLSIVFDPYSSLAVAVSDAVQIAPVFSAETDAGCASSLSPR